MKLLFFVQMVNEQDTIRGFIPGWIRALAAEVDQLTVLAQEVHPASFPDNVRVLSLKKEEGLPKWRQLLRCQKILSDEFRSGRVDTVLTHMTPVYTWLAAPLAGLHGVPVFTWYTHRHVSTMLRGADRLSRRCFTASEASYRLDSTKKTVVGHGIDNTHFESSEDPLLATGPLRFVTAQRMSPVKRLDVLLEALSNLEGDWTLDIAGDAPMPEQQAYEKILRDQSASLADKIRWHGAVPYPDMPAFLRRGDVFVNLSATGSTDKAVLEALLAGPTIMTGNEAFADFVGDTRARTYLDRVNVKSLQDRLRELMTLDRSMLIRDRDVLRAQVENDHGLPRLAQRLVNEMQAAR